MAIETKPFDAAEILNSDERITAYLDEAFEDGDAGVIAAALGTVARARNMSMIARDAGLTRDTHYKALSAAQSSVRDSKATSRSKPCFEK